MHWVAQNYAHVAQTGAIISQRTSDLKYLYSAYRLTDITYVYFKVYPENIYINEFRSILEILAENTP